MPLTLIATPVGNIEDISIRAKKALEDHHIIIGEEPKASRKILVDLGISPRDKEMHFLNEHSSADDLNNLLSICKFENVVLMSDCGTPAFCDPGANLVQLCHQNKIQVISMPGPSSLMTFIAMIGERWDCFKFLGFPPRDKNERASFFKSLTSHKEPVFFLEAPYRLVATLETLNEYCPNTKVHLGSNLTAENEEYFYDLPKAILGKLKNSKAPFIIGLSNSPSRNSSNG